MKGIVVSAEESVVGTTLQFDENGDIVSRDITILNVTDSKETFVTKITVK
jgi:hypothetical protein